MSQELGLALHLHVVHILGRGSTLGGSTTSTTLVCFYFHFTVHDQKALLRVSMYNAGRSFFLFQTHAANETAQRGYYDQTTYSSFNLFIIPTIVHALQSFYNR